MQIAASVNEEGARAGASGSSGGAEAGKYFDFSSHKMQSKLLEHLGRYGLFNENVSFCSGGIIISSNRLPGGCTLWNLEKRWLEPAQKVPENTQKYYETFP